VRVGPPRQRRRGATDDADRRPSANELASTHVPTAAPQIAPKGDPPEEKPITIRIEPREGGWRLEELICCIGNASERRISIIFDTWNGPVTPHRVFVRSQVIEEKELFGWLTSLLEPFPDYDLAPLCAESTPFPQQWFGDVRTTSEVARSSGVRQRVRAPRSETPRDTRRLLRAVLTKPSGGSTLPHSWRFSWCRVT